MFGHFNPDNSVISTTVEIEQTLCWRSTFLANNAMVVTLYLARIIWQDSLDENTNETNWW